MDNKLDFDALHRGVPQTLPYCDISEEYTTGVAVILSLKLCTGRPPDIKELQRVLAAKNPNITFTKDKTGYGVELDQEGLAMIKGYFETETI